MLKIIKIQHIRDDKIIWEQNNLNNTLHILAEQYFLSVLFAGTTLVSNYYMGLDNRATISTSDTMASLVGEPTGINGYLRQVNSSNSWAIDFINGVYVAISGIITFQANGGSFGPVQNLFVATTADNSGVLLSSVPLVQSVTVNSGDNLNMTTSMSLQDFSA